MKSNSIFWHLKKKKEENPLIDSVRSKYTKMLNIEKKENDELSKSAVDY